MLKRLNWLATIILTVSLFSASSVLALAPASAGMQLITKYPGIETQPGETADFPLKLNDTGSPVRVDLKVLSAPKGWQTFIKADGNVVTQAFAGKGTVPNIDFQADVPQNAKPGTYTLVVGAEGNGINARLSLDVLVTAVGTGLDTMKAEYPDLSGSATANFAFSVNLTNNGARERSYSLAADPPAGWQVTFSPSGEANQVASISVQPGQSQDLNVAVTPPAKVRTGTYKIPLKAVSNNSRTGTTLEVVISGSYAISVTTPSGRLNADAMVGRKTPLTLTIKNTGSSDLRQVALSASAPPDWAVTFDPGTIPALQAGASRQVTAFIKPYNKDIAGDYALTVSAKNADASGSAAFRVAVKTSTLWGAVGIILVLLVVGGVGYIFWKFGRR